MLPPLSPLFCAFTTITFCSDVRCSAVVPLPFLRYDTVSLPLRRYCWLPLLRLPAVVALPVTPCLPLPRCLFVRYGRLVVAVTACRYALRFCACLPGVLRCGFRGFLRVAVALRVVALSLRHTLFSPVLPRITPLLVRCAFRGYVDRIFARVSPDCSVLVLFTVVLRWFSLLFVHRLVVRSLIFCLVYPRCCFCVPAVVVAFVGAPSALRCSTVPAVRGALPRCCVLHATVRSCRLRLPRVCVCVCCCFAAFIAAFTFTRLVRSFHRCAFTAFTALLFRVVVMVARCSALRRLTFVDYVAVRCDFERCLLFTVAWCRWLRGLARCRVATLTCHRVRYTFYLPFMVPGYTYVTLRRSAPLLLTYIAV